MAKVIKAASAKAVRHGRFVMRGDDNARKAKSTRSARIGRFVGCGAARFESVMKAAENSGLLGEKSMRIGGRISPALLEQAKKRIGIQTDTDLIEFALAKIALDDEFGRTFGEVRSTVDPSLKLGF